MPQGDHPNCGDDSRRLVLRAKLQNEFDRGVITKLVGPNDRRKRKSARMDTRLNFFSPYEKVAAWHENQLTRALLVLLRYSPICHQAWLQLVAPDGSLQLYDLPKPDFATQRQRIRGANAALPESDAMRGISVWLAPDATRIDDPVEPSDRRQILDGIVTYGSDLVVVIENKIKPGPISKQPRQINVHGLPIIFDEVPRSITWQRLLEVVSDLMERDLVFGPERLLVSDFLEFVEQHFPEVGPYLTLRRCGTNQFRLERRLDNIQGSALKTDVGKALGWREIKGTRKIFMAWLGLAEGGSDVSLQMYPGDTLGQARALYSDPASVRAALALQPDNWTIKPNFHWGFMAGGYAWMASPLSVDDYCAHWIREIADTRELSRAEWEDYWSRLEAARIVLAQDKAIFDAEFTHTNRQRAQPRPGLRCEYRWPLKEATRLDEGGQFVKAVRSRVNDMLSALRAPRIGTRQS